jgi:hypothetical protein
VRRAFRASQTMIATTTTTAATITIQTHVLI